MRLPMAARRVPGREQFAGRTPQGITQSLKPRRAEAVEVAAAAGDAVDPAGVQATADEPTIYGSRPRLADESVDRPAAGGQQFGEQQTYSHAQRYPWWALLTIVDVRATIGARHP